MVGFQLEVAGHSFEFIDEITPERAGDGSIRAIMPQQEYHAANSSYVHRYGWGPFCSFTITTEREEATGVYAICSGDSILYIGETTDIDTRFNQGYGSIHPRNCFEDGQETNCRINSLLREAAMNWHSLHLFFYETENRKALEAQLIPEVNPPWNKTGAVSQTPKSEVSAEQEAYDGKYSPLKEHLLARDDEVAHFTFSEIENILGFSLPNSAHKFPAWWGNGSQRHSYAWLDAGWRVDELSLPNNTVNFKRT